MAAMHRVPVDSKSLRSVGYDASTRKLEVEFHSGRVYAFAEVPASVHDWLMRSPNKGGFFNRMIRERYEVRQVGQDEHDGDLESALRKSLEPARDD
jgi:hypothetical protein